MEINAQSGVGGYSACDIPNKVKGETATLGFRVKSGWAAAVHAGDDLPMCEIEKLCRQAIQTVGDAEVCFVFVWEFSAQVHKCSLILSSILAK